MVNSPADALPYVVNFSVPGLRSETLLHHLAAGGVYVSSGSACSSNTGHGSYVLRAFGLDDREADCTIRVSIGAQNTLADADGFVEEFASALSSLVRMMR